MDGYDSPVNARPKINSLGGVTCLGVVVLVISMADGFMSGSRANSSSWDCML